MCCDLSVGVKEMAVMDSNKKETLSGMYWYLFAYFCINLDLCLVP